jgi:hypothetical protein
MNSLSRFIAQRADAFFLALLLLVSLCVNLFLGFRIWEMKRAPLELSTKTGVTLPPIKVTNLDGKSQTIGFSTSEPETVLYVLNPSCIWCNRNMDNIKALSNSEGQVVRFVGISLKDPLLNAYVQTKAIPFPVYSIDSYAAVKGLLLGSTPQTIVVQPGGKVVKNWAGAFAGKNQKEIESYFNIRLPGLLPQDSSSERH